MAKKQQKAPRQFSLEFKQQAVQRMQSGVSTTALAKELGIRRKLLYQWRDRVVAGKPIVGQSGRPRNDGQQRQNEERAHSDQLIAELERKIGQQQMVIDFFKGALQQIRHLRRLNSGTGVMASSGKSGQ
ncbi:MAG: transposase [Bryobacteraceae bacterium]